MKSRSKNVLMQAKMNPIAIMIMSKRFHTSAV